MSALWTSIGVALGWVLLAAGPAIVSHALMRECERGVFGLVNALAPVAALLAAVSLAAQRRIVWTAAVLVASALISAACFFGCYAWSGWFG